MKNISAEAMEEPEVYSGDIQLTIHVSIHEPHPVKVDNKFIMDVLQYVQSGDIEFDYSIGKGE